MTTNVLQHRRRGFSMVEILFAVIILAIGFIMVAALFPVAIGQAKAAAEETVSARLIDNATATLQTGRLHGSLTATNGQTLPLTNQTPSVIASPGLPRVFLFDDPRVTAASAIPNNSDPDIIWKQCVQGLCLSSASPAAAWTGLYSRGGTALLPDSTITLYSFSLADRNTSQFTAADVSNTPTPATPVASATALPNVCARPVEVWSLQGGQAPPGSPPNAITLQTVSGTPSGALLKSLSISENAINSAVEGGYVVISDDNGTGQMNGRIYRLAGVAPTPSAPATVPTVPTVSFYLDPGTPFAPNDLAMSGTDNSGRIAFVIGAGFTDPSTATSASGSSMATGYHISTLPLAP